MKKMWEESLLQGELSRVKALELLELPTEGPEFEALLQAADTYSRNTFQGKGKIFAQIGLDWQPCSGGCQFCSLAAACGNQEGPFYRDPEETAALAGRLARSGGEDIFLMTTADYPREQFLSIIAAVRKAIPEGTRMVANTGDFDLAYARRLKEAGCTGAYHICRLREGVDTAIPLQRRMQTLEAIRDAGLELYYCVEPIGPEHTNEELVEEMLRIRDFPVGVMAVMKRVAVPGTKLAANGEIPSQKLAQICAVATLLCRPERAMGVHEPDRLCLRSGANQIYGEYGVNPRDTERNTEENRGYSLEKAQKLLEETGWSCQKGGVCND